MDEVNYEVKIPEQEAHLKLDEVMEYLHRSISGYTRNGKDFYIGMTSGFSIKDDDVIRAMKTRYDASKRSKGINRMIAIFKTSSERRCKQVETELIEYYDDYDGLLNERGGGGGRESSKPWKYVYIAIQEPPKE